MNPINLLSIENEEARKTRYESIIKDSESYKNLLLNSYMALAKKNQQENYKKYTRSLKIFPQYFAINTEDFYHDPEIEQIKKILLDLEIKMNIFDQSKTVQCCFWYTLFNFMTPIKCEIEISTARRKILTSKYCRKSNPESRTLQNAFKSLEKNGLLLQTSKKPHYLLCSASN